ncbi:hypothetical protein [Pseudomonas psychrophila]|uniref:hypothetical protein n=1 Tax=Pseudomonas psychrophila TaxID=122355 RepID=UPI0037F8461F
MSSMENLAEALRLKREKDEAASAPSNEQVQQWEQSLKTLFAQLESWMSPLIESGVAKVRRVTKTKSENPSSDVFVSYEVPMLIIEINHKTAVVDVIGLFVSNTDGRVGLIGDDKRFLISRSLSPTEGWIISTYLNTSDTAPSVERPLSEEALAEALANYL